LKECQPERLEVNSQGWSEAKPLGDKPTKSPALTRRRRKVLRELAVEK